jgi:hypothetical protein
VQGVRAGSRGVKESTPVQERLAHLDWEAIEPSLWGSGYAKTPPLLTSDECAELIRLYPEDSRFRSRVDMARYRFGLGEYKYFADPLPAAVASLRVHTYAYLAPIANRWMEALGARERYPPDLGSFLTRCARHGQAKPTPLLLRYEKGGYNCLHQDIYGDVVFPIQLTCLLSRRGVDYEGGEFLLIEQRPRAQSRGEVVVLEQGEAVIFATRHRPVAGTRGYYRANLRHGVSRVTWGERFSLGVIFHNAK